MGRMLTALKKLEVKSPPADNSAARADRADDPVPEPAFPSAAAPSLEPAPRVEPAPLVESTPGVEPAPVAETPPAVETASRVPTSPREATPSPIDDAPAAKASPNEPSVARPALEPPPPGPAPRFATEPIGETAASEGRSAAEQAWDIAAIVAREMESATPTKSRTLPWSGIVFDPGAARPLFPVEEPPVEEPPPETPPAVKSRGSQPFATPLKAPASPTEEHPQRQADKAPAPVVRTIPLSALTRDEGGAETPGGADAGDPRRDPSASAAADIFARHVPSTPKFEPAAPRASRDALGAEAMLSLSRQTRAELSREPLGQQLRALGDRLREEFAQQSPVVVGWIGFEREPLAARALLALAALLSDSKAGAVLLVDANLQDGFLTAEFGAAGEIGLGEALAKDAPLGQVVLSTWSPSLHLLPAGKVVLAPEDHKPKLAPLLRACRSRYSWVLVECGVTAAPLAPQAARLCDGVYALPRLGATELAQAQADVAALRGAGARLLGCVGLNP